MNFRKLLTYLTVGTAAVIPFAGAQNPTILQGSYISNVFGNSNFVKNPNAQTNVANVTNATRSTTTPLVATSEFNLSLDAGQNATWTLRTFDAGMKGQNCEARFSYRGFATATTTAEIVQNSLVVAQLVLTPSTDPRIASINFPCGDPANATTFRIAQTTANMTGTNEIGGVYTGLATNMANVAQAEFVGAVKWTATTSCEWAFFNTTSYTSFTADADCTTPTGSNIEGQASAPGTKIPAIKFSSLKPGRYVFTATGNFSTGGASPASVTRYDAFFRFFDGTNAAKNENQLYVARADGADGPSVPVISGEFEYSASQSNITIEIQAKTNNGGANNAYAVVSNVLAPLYISVYRFPTSSELVVTPERQNTFAGLKGVATTATNTITSAAWTKLTSTSTLTRTSYGKAKVETNDDYSITIENMPVGSYQISATGVFQAESNGSANRTVCNFGIADTATGAAQIAGIQVSSTGDSSAAAQYIVGQTLQGVYQNTSVANKTFFLQAYRNIGNGACSGYSDSVQPLTISVIPLDQPSNSALYVEGPVKASATGAAIPAGYVGETIIAENNSFVTTGMTNSTTVAFLNITLTPGTWLISASQTVLQNGSTGTAFSSTLSDVSTSGNTMTGIGVSATDNSGWPSNNVHGVTVTHLPFIYSTATSKTIYLNSFALFTIGTPSRKGTIRAVRIN
jgi:hypothetical protein